MQIDEKTGEPMISVRYPFLPGTDPNELADRLNVLEDELFAEVEKLIEGGDLSAIGVSIGTPGFMTDEEHLAFHAGVLKRTREGRNLGDARTAEYHVFTAHSLISMSTGSGPLAEKRAEWIAAVMQLTLIKRYLDRHPEVVAEMEQAETSSSA